MSPWRSVAFRGVTSPSAHGSTLEQPPVRCGAAARPAQPAVWLPMCIITGDQSGVSGARYGYVYIGQVAMCRGPVNWHLSHIDGLRSYTQASGVTAPWTNVPARRPTSLVAVSGASGTGCVAPSPALGRGEATGRHSSVDDRQDASLQGWASQVLVLPGLDHGHSIDTLIGQLGLIWPNHDRHEDGSSRTPSSS
jgi:hypothetical protein